MANWNHRVNDWRPNAKNAGRADVPGETDDKLDSV